MNVATIDIWSPVAVIVAAVSGCSGFILSQFGVNYNLNNLFRDIRNVFARMLFGKRFIARIDGIWRLVRGWKDNGYLNAVFPPEYKLHKVDFGNFRNVDQDWSDEEVENKIARLNIQDLKSNHPNPNDARPRWNHGHMDDFEIDLEIVKSRSRLINIGNYV